MEHSGSLWLEREPSAEEVKAAFADWDMDRFKEVVFCGFGEPTERIEEVLEVAAFVKTQYNKTIRINTNGLGSLIHGRDIAPSFAGKIDIVSISLNTPNAEEYNKLTRSKFGIAAYQGMLDFAREVKQYVSQVVMTTVETTITKEEEAQCRAICEELGVTYRIRPFED